jgi:hypothetical protein
MACNRMAKSAFNGLSGCYPVSNSGLVCFSAAHTACGKCVSANETGRDCMGGCEFKYSKEEVDGEMKCVNANLEEAKKCDGQAASKSDAFVNG